MRSMTHQVEARVGAHQRLSIPLWRIIQFARNAEKLRQHHPRVLAEAWYAAHDDGALCTMSPRHPLPATHPFALDPLARSDAVRLLPSFYQPFMTNVWERWIEYRPGSIEALRLTRDYELRLLYLAFKQIKPAT